MATAEHMTTVSIDREIHKVLKWEALKKEETLGEVIARLVREHLPPLPAQDESTGHSASII